MKIKLIVGLANPGEKYQHTRHNAGAWVLEALAEKYNLNFKTSKFFAEVTKLNFAGEEIILAIPTTFMNLSGKAVGAIANFYKITPEQILVCHDELDLPVGVAKFKQGGGAAGHNGLKDIISALGNKNNFYRLRIGISRPELKNDVANFVLKTPPTEDREKINQAIKTAINAIEDLLKNDFTKACNNLHAFKAI